MWSKGKSSVVFSVPRRPTGRRLFQGLPALFFLAPDLGRHGHLRYQLGNFLMSFYLCIKRGPIDRAVKIKYAFFSAWPGQDVPSQDSVFLGQHGFSPVKISGIELMQA
jgi:hypothetical protein